jgi:hypothetical protein
MASERDAGLPAAPAVNRFDPVLCRTQVRRDMAKRIGLGRKGATPAQATAPESAAETAPKRRTLRMK